MTRIFIVQSDAAVALAMAQTLSRTPGLDVVGRAHTLARARDWLAKQSADLVIADLRLPDGRFVDWFVHRTRLGGRAQWLMVAEGADDPLLMQALVHGADGYIVRGRPMDALVFAIRQVLAGEAMMAPEVAIRVLEHFETQARRDPHGAFGQLERMTLNDAERRVLRSLADGELVDEIAYEMRLSSHQIGHRIRRLYLKLELDLRPLDGGPALLAA
jgi:DNA-binding NarL/FixJ family response regulator